MKTSLTLLSCPLALLIACGCSMLKPQTDIHRLEDLPLSYTTTATNNVLLSAWWKSLANTELNDLMESAFSGSPSFAQAAARFRQANASASKLSAASFPSVSGSASVSSAKQQATSDDGSTTKLSIDNYGLGLAASYELDLWGRVHSVRRSAGLNAEASFLDLETAAMSLSARIAELWIQSIEARAGVDLITKQIETNSKALDLLKERATKSNTTLLDVYQQEQLLRVSESRLPAAMQRMEILKNELDVLVGRHAGTGPAIKTDELPALPPFPGNGVPADILNNRPDVKAQQLRLQAAGWDTAAARADRLPAIRLSAKYEYSSDRTSTLFDNWISSLAAGLTAPLIDGGQKRAESRRSKAALDAAMASYRETVLNAFKEVQNALVTEKRSTETFAALSRQLESSRKALDEATNRYRNGNVSYLSVLTALRSVYQTELDLYSSHSSVLQARIALHRALGGTWTRAAARSAAESDFEQTLTTQETAEKDKNNE